MLALAFIAIAAVTIVSLWLASSLRKLSAKDKILNASIHAKAELGIAVAKLREQLAEKEERVLKAEAELRQTNSEWEGCLQDEERKAKALREDLEVHKQKALQLEQKLKRSQQALSSAQKTTRPVSTMGLALSPMPQGTPGLVFSPLPSTPPQPQDLYSLLTQARQELQQTQIERNAAEQQVNDVQSTVAELQEKLAVVLSQCQGLTHDLTSKMESLSAAEAKASEAEEHAGGLQGEVEQLTAQVSSLNGQLAANQQDVEAAQTRADGLQNAVQQLTTQAMDLEGQVSTKTAEAATAQAQVSSLQTSLSHVQSELDKQLSQLSQVATELTQSKEQVQQAQDKLQQQEQAAAASLAELQEKLQLQEQTAAASLAELHAKLQQHEQTAATLQAQIAELQSKLQRQVQETDVVQADRDQLVEQLEQAQRQNQEARDDLVKDLDRTKNDLGIALIQADHFSQEVNHLSGTMERHEMAYDDMYRMIACYKALMANVQQHGMSVVVEQAEQLESVMDQLTSHVSILLQNKQDLHKDCEVLAAEIKGLQMVRDAHKDRLAQVEVTCAEWQSQTKELSSTVSEHEAQKAVLCQLLEEVRVEAAEVKLQLESKGQVLAGAEARVGELEQQVAETSQLLKGAEARVGQLEAHLEDGRRALQAGDVQTGALQNEVQQLTVQVVDLEGQVATKTAEVAAAQARADGLQDEVQQLTDKVTEMEERISKASVAYAELEQQVSQLNAELDKVQGEAAELYDDNEVLAEQVEVYCNVLAELQRVVQHPVPSGADGELEPATTVPLLQLPRRVRKVSTASSAGTGADPLPVTGTAEDNTEQDRGSGGGSVGSQGTQQGTRLVAEASGTSDGRRPSLRQTRSPRMSVDDSVLQALRIQVPKLKADVAMAEAEASTLRGQMMAVRDQLHAATQDLDTARRLAQDAARDKTIADTECATATKALESARAELDALRTEHGDVCGKYTQIRSDFCTLSMELSTVCTDLSCLLEGKSGQGALASAQQREVPSSSTPDAGGDDDVAGTATPLTGAGPDVDGAVMRAQIIKIGTLVSELTLQHERTLKSVAEQHQQALQDKEQHLNTQHQQAVVEMAAQLNAQHQHSIQDREEQLKMQAAQHQQAIQEREEQLSALIAEKRQAIEDMEDQVRTQAAQHQQTLQEMVDKLGKAEEAVNIAQQSEQSVRDELDQLIQSALEFESRNKQLCDQHQVLMRNYQELQLVSESEMERCRELQAEVDELQGELSQVRMQLTCSEDELAKVKQQLTRVQDQHQQAQQELATSQEQHEHERQELERQLLGRQRHTNASFIDRAAERARDSVELWQRVEELQGQLQAAQAELVSMRAGGSGSEGGDDDLAIGRTSDGSVMVTRIGRSGRFLERMKQVARTHGELVRRTSRSQSPPPLSHPLLTATTCTPLVSSPRRTTLDTMVEMASPAMSGGGGGAGSGGGGVQASPGVANGSRQSSHGSEGSKQHADLMGAVDAHYLTLHSHYSELLSEFCETENHLRSLMIESGGNGVNPNHLV